MDILLDEILRGRGYSSTLVYTGACGSVSVGQDEEGAPVVNVHLDAIPLYITGGRALFDAWKVAEGTGERARFIFTALVEAIKADSFAFLGSLEEARKDAERFGRNAVRLEIAHLFELE